MKTIRQHGSIVYVVLRYGCWIFLAWTSSCYSSMRLAGDAGDLDEGDFPAPDPGQDEPAVENQLPDGPSQQRWSRTYGGERDDWAPSVVQTADGGFIVAGSTISFSPGHEGSNYWAIKLSSEGYISWEKTYGHDYDEMPNDIIQTSDRGYVIAGVAFPQRHPQPTAAWVLKLNEEGGVAWQKMYSTDAYDSIWRISQTSDGGYLTLGTYRSSLQVLGDSWIVKLDSDGSVAWQNHYGRIGNDDGMGSIVETEGGGYIAAGYSIRSGSEYMDIWIIKLAEDGNLVWQKVYGTDLDDWAVDIRQLPDGSYIIGCTTEISLERSLDVCIAKISENGDLLWSRVIGGLENDVTGSMSLAPDGGTVIAAETRSFGAGRQDIWILKFDAGGHAIWQKTYGTSGWERLGKISETSESGFIVACETDSLGSGGLDFWVLKIDEEGNCADDCPSSVGMETEAYVEDLAMIQEETAVSAIEHDATVQDTSVSGSGTDSQIVTQCGG